jgi:hypothetical protein
MDDAPRSEDLAQAPRLDFVDEPANRILTRDERRGFDPSDRLAHVARVQATIATFLLGGSGSSPLSNEATYASLASSSSSVAVISFS